MGGGGWGVERKLDTVMMEVQGQEGRQPDSGYPGPGNVLVSAPRRESFM